MLSSSSLLRSQQELQDAEKMMGEEILCKYCYEADVSEDNPLMSVCPCKGSSGYVHKEELMHYLDTKKQTVQ